MTKEEKLAARLEYERTRMKLLTVLSSHPGPGRAISMVALYREVFGERPEGDKINGTRKLRKYLTSLRREGIPICHSTDTDSGGYYLASAASDVEEQCGRLRAQALKKLMMEAKLRNVALPALLGQIGLALAREEQRSGEL